MHTPPLSEASLQPAEDADGQCSADTRNCPTYLPTRPYLHDLQAHAAAERSAPAAGGGRGRALQRRERGLPTRVPSQPGYARAEPGAHPPLRNARSPPACCDKAWWGLVLLAMHVALVQPLGQLTEDIEQEKMTPSTGQYDAQNGSISPLPLALAYTACLQVPLRGDTAERRGGRLMQLECARIVADQVCAWSAQPPLLDKPGSPCMPPAGSA
jgi:hypothetical protein